MNFEIFGDKARNVKEGQMFKVEKTFTREGRPVAVLEEITE